MNSTTKKDTWVPDDWKFIFLLLLPIVTIVLLVLLFK